MKRCLSAALLLASAPLWAAKPSVNDMQGCQAVVDFVTAKLNPPPAAYAAEDVEKVEMGLAAYHRFIQQSIITPGLLEYSSGDADKAAALQRQINNYKEQVVEALNKRYPQPRLFADHAIQVNECAKKTVPTGQDLESLKLALQTMLKLAGQH